MYEKYLCDFFAKTNISTAYQFMPLARNLGFQQRIGPSGITNAGFMKQLLKITDE